MKNLTFLFFVFLMLPMISSQAQILTIVENDQGKKKTISENGAQIVDINGNLELSISKTELTTRIQNDYPQFSNQIELQSKIDALEKALVNQQALLKALDQKTLKQGDKQAFYNAILNFLDAIIADPGLEAAAEALSEEWIDKYGEASDNWNTVSLESYLLTHLSKNLITAKDELSNYKGLAFNISMVAYIQTKLSEDDRVHIRNFDTYSDREFYSVPRWVTSLSEDQTEKLKELQEKADEYNAQAPNYLSNFKAELLDNFPEVDCLGSLKVHIQDFLGDDNIKDDITDAIKQDITILIDKYDTIVAILNKIKQDLSNWTIDTPFEVIEDAKNLVANVSNLKDLFDKITNTTVVISSLTVEVGKLKTEFDECFTNLTKAADILLRSTGIIKDQKSSFDATKEIGEEVLKFSIDNLPETGYIKLEGAGPRENGDKIEIDLLMRVPKNDNGDSTVPARSTSEDNEIIASRTVTMQIIGLRSEAVAGIILADSFSENGFTPVEDRRFLYAPAVSLLLKVGSRNSKIYNEFIDFGFGLALSTPDFNTDGTPEFGAGLMLTAFKDILSVGINYNVTLDTPYWSFGINIPFTMPGIPINVPK